MLICPNCKSSLVNHQNNYRCTKGHTFDKAREGYVNLILPNQKKKLNPGDNKGMITSREQFLSKGHYDFLVDIILNQLKAYCINNNINPNYEMILDVGCGSGYYTRKVISSKLSKHVVGLDISKNAIAKASKIDKLGTYIVASAFRLPIADNSVRCILNVFSPLDLTEASRVLAPQGFILKVVPAGNHMNEIAQLIYDEVLPHDTELIKLIERNNNWTLEEIVTIEKQADLEKEDAIALINMTPYKYKFDPSRLMEVSNMKITCAFKLLIIKSKV